MARLLITGTPGTGKSTLCSLLTKQLSSLGIRAKHININDVAQTHNLLDEFDEMRQCHTIDEDKLIDVLHEIMSDDECVFVVDHHACDFFQSADFEKVYVLRSILSKRLREREYDDKKISENVSAEIFQTILDDAREVFEEPNQIEELCSENEREMQENVEKIVDFVKKLLEKQQKS